MSLIALTYWTLLPNHKNYSQVEKAFPPIFGIRKFHTNLYRRKLTLVTDHKPLTTIFGEKKLPGYSVGQSNSFYTLIRLNSAVHKSTPMQIVSPDCLSIVSA